MPLESAASNAAHGTVDHTAPFNLPTGVLPWLCALLAVAAPLLLAWNVPPSSTFLNQALAIGGWGLFLSAILAAMSPGVPDRIARGPGLLAACAALASMAVAAAVAGLSAALPGSLAASACGLILATGFTLWCAAQIASRQGPARALEPVCWALLVAGLASAVVALVQVFAPGWADGVLIAVSGLPGRAVGNLRQPNHLASLTLWALIALAWLADARRLPRPFAAVLALLLVFSVVLSFSRTGTVGILVLGLWGLLGRPLAPDVRWALGSLPGWYALGWWAATHGTEVAAGGAARFSTQGDISSSRFAIWSDTLQLIAARPWTGVGYGDFNFAWTLTSFPHRPTAFFDHTHNLPLQFAVELGLPLALLLLGLLGFALWRALRGAPAAPDRSDAVAARCAFMLVLMIAVHSLLEYPLWYAYFLLPTAYALGVSLGTRPLWPATETRSGPRDQVIPGLRVGAALLAAAGAFAVVDYWKVVVIFAPGPGAGPLAERIDAGKRSVFFAHHAHYAAATTATQPAQALDSFRVASHFLLDTRLMLAWAQAYADNGDIERARHLADRLREFRNPSSEDFFDACTPARAKPAVAPPFQCLPAAEAMDDRSFR